MSLDHAAIIRAYPDAAIVDDGLGAFDEKGNLIELEQSKIDEARTALNAEAAAVKYKTDRTTDGSTIYPPIGDQLDALWKGGDDQAAMKVIIDKVKSDYPKG